jgi:predicted amidophosphoribosyltransferase
MCWWCFSPIEGAADYCPRCQRSLRMYPEQWASDGDATAIERCPLCEGRFTRFDDDCPGCGHHLINSRRDFLNA